MNTLNESPQWESSFVTLLFTNHAILDKKNNDKPCALWSIWAKISTAETSRESRAIS